MTSKFCIIDAPFPDWITIIKQNKKIKFFTVYDIIKLDLSKYKIISISIPNYNSFNNPTPLRGYNLKNNIFNNNLDNIDLLDNKSKFSEYMITNYKNNYAETYYYNYNDLLFINKSNDIHNKFIIASSRRIYAL
jgi:hypothetical protein